MDKLRGMETFIAVVECGSFTGAASRLGLSAVMVGKYIAQLESQLATRLLERNTRRQRISPIISACPIRSGPPATSGGCRA